MSAIETSVFASAVDGTVRTLQDPPGRAPAARTMVLHDWYDGLSPEDKSMVAEAVRAAAATAVFGFLCVLDGIRAIDDPPHGELRLTIIDASGAERRLNGGPIELHDLFRGG